MRANFGCQAGGKPGAQLRNASASPQDDFGEAFGESSAQSAFDDKDALKSILEGCWKTNN